MGGIKGITYLLSNRIFMSPIRTHTFVCFCMLDAGWSGGRVQPCALLLSNFSFLSGSACVPAQTDQSHLILVELTNHVLSR